MTLYQVTVTADPQIRDAFASYMRTRHIDDVLATGCFDKAEFATDGDRFRTTYAARDRAELDRYLSGHADRLRADFAAHFPGGVTVSRETWEVIEEWTR